MTEEFLLSYAQNALVVTMMLAAPVLLTSLVIGSLISLFQAATQINEVTLTFVPKIIGVVIIIALLGSWMGQQILNFTSTIFLKLPELVF
jgi:flagellar biosynthetic protein FliQ